MQSPAHIFAKYGLIIASSFLILFHLSVLLGLIPYTSLWGGMITDSTQAVLLECVALLISVCLLFLVLQRYTLMQQYIGERVSAFGLGIMAVIFFFGTLGNIFSPDAGERLYAAPVMGIFTVLAVLSLIRLR